ncbi:hypothetical protein CMMCAS03_05575 [Clavibacter michiganensis subsp. michiganensis]|nr:hypothetical protein CMMCAS03_05575 [Clavibacter michiganensis subsp. michiganensis]
MAAFAEKTVLPARAAYAARPASDVIAAGASETMRPSKPTIARFSSCSSRHQTTSLRSPKVQTMAMPDPLSGCARWCASTGTSTPNTGVVTVVPKSPWYRSSSGCATRATHAARSSGRVVSMITSSPPARWNARRW